jgi:ceramide glucosyltransferase
LLIWAAAAAAISNLAFWVVLCVARARRSPPLPELPADPPRVTLIRPFRGLEARAVEKNLSLLRQDYPNLEVLFVAEDEDDPGMPAARLACAQVPGRGRTLVSRGVGVFSGKVRNMSTGWHASSSELVGFCDSDIALAPGDLTACVRPLLQAEVGGSWMPVVCEERGLHGRLWLLVTAVDGVPFQLAAPVLKLRQSLQGGLMVVRRAALQAAGGVEQLGDTFADDVRAGNVLQRAGFALRSSERLLHHASAPDPFPGWLLRFHRWTLCIRSEAPVEFFAQLAMNPVAVPLLAVGGGLASGAGAAEAATVLAASALSRTLGTLAADHLLLRPRGLTVGADAVLRPLADLLFFALSFGALLFPFVKWRGRWYRVGLDGRITHARAGAPAAGALDPGG